MFGFVGLMSRPDGLEFNPRLPLSWRVMTFRVQWRGRSVHVRLDQATHQLTATLEQGEPLTLLLNGRRHVVHLGHSVDVSWTQQEGVR